jgi:signal transduction histidine kinase
MQQLHQMTTHLLGMREIPNALAEVLDATMQIQNADFGKVQVYNPTLQVLELVAHRGFPEKLLGYFASVSRDHDSASGIAFKLKQRVIIEDVESYSDYPLNRDVAALAGYRAAQATPLLSRSGELLGMLSTHFRRPRRPTERELRILDLYARQAADFIEVLNIEQEVRKSRELLQQQANELEEQLIASGRLVSLGEVTASMAHEFNNPLGIILGFVQDMLNSTESDDRDYRALQIINEEAERCRRIVQRLMDLSRPQPTELSPTKLDDVIMRTVSLVESRLYKQKIDLETALQPDLPKVLADYQQIEQVLVNLVFNAIDAMPDGGKLTIAAQTARRNGRSSMMLSVSDTGVGIDNESMSKIFLPFYTAGKKRGLGLGLSICERIVKNHRGRIEVDSCVGEGTTFKFYLPLYSESVESRESAMLS